MALSLPVGFFKKEYTIKHDHSLDKFHNDNAFYLDKAYKNKEKYYFIKDDTMYIAGTDNKNDVYDDITKVPAWGDLTKSERYKMVKPVLDNHPEIKKFVGHSLSGNVVLTLQKEMPERKFEVVTYGAPVLYDWKAPKGLKIQRFKHPGDPISIMDWTANSKPIPSLNPLTLHSYKGYTYNGNTHDIEPNTLNRFVNPIKDNYSYQIN